MISRTCPAGAGESSALLRSSFASLGERRRKLERGVTLIEILLALLVMVLGIVGILALFPAALQASKESVEETQAGIMSESVAQAITNSIRFSTWDAGKARYRVVLVHDLKETNTNSYVRYAFWLPKLVNEDWFHYPTTTADAPSVAAADGLTTYIGQNFATTAAYDPESLPAFRLGGDPWIHSSVQNVKDTNDPSDPYEQFGFSFAVMKINTLAYLIGTPIPNGGGAAYTEASLEPMVKMYEFRINVFRMYTDVQGGGTGTTTSTTVKKLIAQTTVRVAVK